MDPHKPRAIREAVAVAKQVKVNLVRRHGLSDEGDLPVCAQLYRNGSAVAFIAPETESRDLARLLITATIGLSGADAVLGIADTFSFIASGVAGEAPPDFEQSLGEAFARGDPRVVEALMVALWVPSGLVSGALVTYRVTSGRRVNWGDVKDMSNWGEITGGLLHDAIVEGLRVANEVGRKAAEDWRELASIVTVDEMNVWPPVLLPAPPRNEPCSCGSGRKAKWCCYASERK